MPQDKQSVPKRGGSTGETPRPDEIGATSLSPAEPTSPAPVTNGDGAAPEGETERGFNLKDRFFNLRTLISFVIGIVAIVVLVRGINVDLADTWARLTTANLFWYGLALAIYWSTFWVRALRWRIFLHNVGYHPDDGVRIPGLNGLTRIISLSWFANCIVPAKLGDAYRAYLLCQESAVSFSRTIGTILAERFLDLLVLIALFATAAVGMVVRGVIKIDLTGILVIAGLGVLLLVALLILRFSHAPVRRLLPKRVVPVFDRFHDGTFASFRRLPLTLPLTVVVWAGEAGRLLLVTWALGLSVPLPLILFVALATALLSAIPITPGGLGLVELGSVGGLQLVMAHNDAVAVTVLDRAISYWSVIVVGLVLYLVSRKK